MTTFEEFNKFAGENGVENVTQEEYTEFVDGKLWSQKRALVMIKNARKKVEADKNKTIEVHLGFPLGGRDFVYPGITIEKAKSQKIPFLIKDGRVIELNQFGEFKGQHLRECEVEVEVSEREGRERTYINHDVRSVRIMDGKVTLQMLLKYARHISQLEQDDVNEYVIVWGEVMGFDPEAIFEDKQKVGEYPLVVNGQLVFNYMMKSGDKFVRVRFGQTKYAKNIMDIPDLSEIAKSGDFDTLTNAYAGETFLGIGRLSKYDYSENGEFINIDASMVVLIPEELTPESPVVESNDPQPESAPAPTMLGKQPSIEEASKPTPAPAGGFNVEEAKKQAEKLRESLKEGKEILGAEFSIQGCRDLGLVPENVPDSVIEKLMKDL